MVEESDLVREILLCLTGIPSDSFSFDANTNYCKNTTCRLETTSGASVDQILKKVSQIATIYKRILQILTKSKGISTTIIFQRFVTSIREIVESYETIVVFLPTKILSKYPQVTILSVYRELNGLEEILKPIGRIFCISSSTEFNIEKLSIWNHQFDILNFLYNELLVEADPTIYSVLRSTFEPYFDCLVDFITYGQPDGLFSVEKDKTFELIHLPDFLKDHKENIVKMGVYLDIMNDTSEKHKMVIALPLFQNWEQQLFLSVENVISKRSEEINTKFTQWLFEKRRLGVLIEKIEKFYFQPPGVLVECLITEKQTAEEITQCILRKIDDPIRFRMGTSQLTGIHTFEQFVLEFQVEYPDSLFFKPEFIATYVKCMQLILKWKKIENMNETIWLSQRDDFVPGKVLLLSYSQHYLQQITFTFTSALETLRAAFHKNLKISRFDLLQKRYETYMNSINSLITTEIIEKTHILYNLHFKTCHLEELENLFQ